MKNCPEALTRDEGQKEVRMKNAKVDKFLNEVKQWQPELARLREIALDCGLYEGFKWMHPCYTWKNKNIVLIHGFKEYCALLFPKGALLKDEENILVQQTENVQSGRQIRFTSVKEIDSLIPTLKAYIFEAVELEKAGAKIKPRKTSDYPVPEELELKFQEDPDFKAAFKALTPGRQRGYLLHFAGARNASTRVARIERNTNRIFNGHGITDCICGLSKILPRCDGSHKEL